MGGAYPHVHTTGAQGPTYATHGSRHRYQNIITLIERSGLVNLLTLLIKIVPPTSAAARTAPQRQRPGLRYRIRPLRGTTCEMQSTAVHSVTKDHVPAIYTQVVSLPDLRTHSGHCARMLPMCSSLHLLLAPRLTALQPTSTAHMYDMYMHLALPCGQRCNRMRKRRCGMCLLGACSSLASRAAFCLLGLALSARRPPAVSPAMHCHNLKISGRCVRQQMVLAQAAAAPCA